MAKDFKGNIKRDLLRNSKKSRDFWAAVAPNKEASISIDLLSPGFGESGVVASTSKAGLMPVLNGLTTAFLRGDGTWASPTATVSATTVETDLGSTAVTSGKFTITDAAVTGSSKILCWQAPGPYTGKGTRADEAEMQPVQVIAVEPGTGSAVVKWQTPPMIVESQDNQRLAPNMGSGTLANSGTNRNIPFTAKRIGKVRGNVKFSYMVLA